MSNFLESNQKQDIRLKVGNIILYEPTDEQRLEIKKDIMKQNIDMNKEESQINYSVVRFIIRECCENGAFIDEYTDLEILEKINNGNKNLKVLEREIVSIIEEVTEDIYYEIEQQLKIYNDIMNVMSVNGDVTKLEKKWNSLNKKHKLGITFKELIDNGIKKEDLENKLKGSN